MTLLKVPQDKILAMLMAVSGIVERRYTLPCLIRPALNITNGLPEQGGGGAGSESTGATAAPEASSDDDDGGDGDGDPDSDRRRSSKHPSPAVTPLKRGKHRTAAAMAGDPSPPQENPRPFDALPDDAFLRESQLVKKPGNPTPIIPTSASTVWRWVKAGTFPAPRKLGPKVTGWRVGDVRAWLQQQAV